MHFTEFLALLLALRTRAYSKSQRNLLGLCRAGGVATLCHYFGRVCFDGGVWLRTDERGEVEKDECCGFGELHCEECLVDVRYLVEAL